MEKQKKFGGMMMIFCCRHCAHAERKTELFYTGKKAIFCTKTHEKISLGQKACGQFTHWLTGEAVDPKIWNFLKY